MASDTLYEQVIRITADYLGPAATRFIDRQIANHLHKSPENLTLEDMPTLIDWTRIGIALLTDKHLIVIEFTHRMQDLARSHQ